MIRTESENRGGLREDGCKVGGAENELGGNAPGRKEG